MLVWPRAADAATHASHDVGVIHWRGPASSRGLARCRITHTRARDRPGLCARCPCEPATALTGSTAPTVAFSTTHRMRRASPAPNSPSLSSLREVPHARRHLCPCLDGTPGTLPDHRQPTRRPARLGRGAGAWSRRRARVSRRSLQRLTARPSRPRRSARCGARRCHRHRRGPEPRPLGTQVRLSSSAARGVPPGRLRGGVPPPPDLG